MIDLKKLKKDASKAKGLARSLSYGERDAKTMQAVIAAHPGIEKDPAALLAECRKKDPRYGKGLLNAAKGVARQVKDLR